MPFSFRLDAKTEALIRRLCTATGRSKSSVVREAVVQYAAENKPTSAAGETAFDRLEPFIGVASTGGSDYSQDTHAKYRASLTRRSRDRRSR
jgi:predicted DNA-binding protein